MTSLAAVARASESSLVRCLLTSLVLGRTRLWIDWLCPPDDLPDMGPVAPSVIERRASLLCVHSGPAAVSRTSERGRESHYFVRGSPFTGFGSATHGMFESDVFENCSSSLLEVLVQVGLSSSTSYSSLMRGLILKAR